MRNNQAYTNRIQSADMWFGSIRFSMYTLHMTNMHANDLWFISHSNSVRLYCRMMSTEEVLWKIHMYLHNSVAISQSCYCNPRTRGNRIESYSHLCVHTAHGIALSRMEALWKQLWRWICFNSHQNRINNAFGVYITALIRIECKWMDMHSHNLFWCENDITCSFRIEKNFGKKIKFYISEKLFSAMFLGQVFTCI